MKIWSLVNFKVLLLFFTTVLFFIAISPVFSASTPGLGFASSFGILGSTYTNTASGTTINGDLGYSTGPATAPTVNGTTHGADGTYNQAGIDQGSALSALASQPCTHTFPAGAVDLATDTTHGPIGVYAPGVYCTTASSAASVGSGGIILSGGGTYIFRINGALTTVSNSVVTLAGASSCDVFWTPNAATTLGANSTFVGTDIDASGITIGSTVNWNGRALAFGGTVSTDTDTISASDCAAVPSSSPNSSTSPSPSPSPLFSPSPFSSSSPSPSPAESSPPGLTNPGPPGPQGPSTGGAPAASSTTPGFPNTGSTGNPLIPRLPNTGIAPEGQYSPWTVSGVYLLISSFLLKLIHI